MFWLLETGSLQNCTSGCWILKAASQARTEFITYVYRTHTTEANIKQEQDAHTISLSSFQYMPNCALRKDRAKYQKLGYNRCAEYVEFFLSESLLSPSTGLFQYVH